MDVEAVRHSLREQLPAAHYAVVERFAPDMIQNATALGLDERVTISGLHTLMADTLADMLFDQSPDCQALLESTKRMYPNDRLVISLRETARDPSSLLTEGEDPAAMFFLDSMSPLNDAAKTLYAQGQLTYRQLLLVDPCALIVGF